MITLAETKLYLRVDSNAFDSEIQTMITAAEQWVQGYTNHVFGERQIFYNEGARIYNFPINDNLNKLELKPNYFIAKEDVTLKVGYVTRANVPELLAEGVKQLVKHWYYGSENERYTDTPMSVKMTVSPFKRFML